MKSLQAHLPVSSMGPNTTLIWGAEVRSNMAVDDIYGNKGRYERFLSRLNELVVPPEEREFFHRKGGRARYICKNSVNLKYFRKLAKVCDHRDLAYVHRNRLMSILKMAVHVFEKDLAEVKREDIDILMVFMFSRYKGYESQRKFVKRLRTIWKWLFPVLDEEGRIDDSRFPYPVRHLSMKSIDKSKHTLRNDRLTFEEFQRLVQYFERDARMQALITLAVESLGRPQEILMRQLKDVEIYDTYAKVWLEKGKEGGGLLQCIDSFSYLVKWIEQHPYKGDGRAFIFINLKGKRSGMLMKPENANKHLRKACRHLGLDKRITMYSLKRAGVTFRRLRGDSDVQIQHAARWTSTAQLQTYDLSQQEDAFQMELKKRGLIEDDGVYDIQSKRCIFCGKVNGFTADYCVQCRRPLDPGKIEEQMQKVNQMEDKLKRFERISGLLEDIFREEPTLLERVKNRAAHRGEI